MLSASLESIDNLCGQGGVAARKLIKSSVEARAGKVANDALCDFYLWWFRPEIFPISKKI